MPNIRKVILMGQYAVVPKPSNNATKIILESPAAQTCIILVLTSESGVAMAHIDSSLYAAETTINMIEKLRRLSSNDANITATLIGGDVGDPVFGSRTIYQSIYHSLKSYGINFNHDNYSLVLPNSFIILAYLMFRMLKLLGPESYIGTIFCALVLYITVMKINERLGKSFDVCVDVASGDIIVISNNNENTRRILGQMTNDQIIFFKARNKLSPRNLDLDALLKMQDVSSSLVLGRP